MLARELQALASRFDPVDLAVAGLLTPEQYAAALHVAFDPYGGEAQPSDGSRRARHLRADGSRHNLDDLAHGWRASSHVLDRAVAAAAGRPAVPHAAAARRAGRPHGLGRRSSRSRPTALARAVEAAITSDEADEELRERRGFRTHGATPSPAGGDAATRGGARVGPRGAPLRRLRHRQRARPRTSSTRACERGRAGRAAGVPRPAAAVGRAGRRLRPRRAPARARAARSRSGGADVRRAARPSATGTARPPPTRRRSTRSSPRAASATAACCIGIDLHGAAFTYDPFVLYEQRVVSNPNLFVAGEVGSGKSSLVKTYLYRQALFGRVPWIADPKGEYAPLARGARRASRSGSSPGGDVRLNPIARDAGWDGQLEPAPRARRRRARATARRRRRKARCARRCARVNAELRRADAAGRRRAAVPADRARWPSGSSRRPTRSPSGSRAVALGLQRLCEGDLRGMFDGPTTPGLRLDGRAVVLDLSRVLRLGGARARDDVRVGVAARDDRASCTPSADRDGTGAARR